LIVYRRIMTPSTIAARKLATGCLLCEAAAVKAVAAGETEEGCGATEDVLEVVRVGWTPTGATSEGAGADLDRVSTEAGEALGVGGMMGATVVEEATGETNVFTGETEQAWVNVIMTVDDSETEVVVTTVDALARATVEAKRIKI
jgi:hypothetical protein